MSEDSLSLSEVEDVPPISRSVPTPYSVTARKRLSPPTASTPASEPEKKAKSFDIDLLDDDGPAAEPATPSSPAPSSPLAVARSPVSARPAAPAQEPQLHVSPARLPPAAQLSDALVHDGDAVAHRFDDDDNNDNNNDGDHVGGPDPVHDVHNYDAQSEQFDYHDAHDNDNDDDDDVFVAHDDAVDDNNNNNYDNDNFIDNFNDNYNDNFNDNDDNYQRDPQRDAHQVGTGGGGGGGDDIDLGSFFVPLSAQLRDGRSVFLKKQLRAASPTFDASKHPSPSTRPPRVRARSMCDFAH